MTTETAIIKRIIKSANQHDAFIAVLGEGEVVLKANRKQTTAEVVDAATACDMSELVILSRSDINENKRARRIGGIALIFGNSPEELVADWTDNAEITTILRDAGIDHA